MKNLTLLTLFFLLFYTTSQAQFSIGPTVGINYSNVEATTITNSPVATGFYFFGASSKFSLSDKLAFITELHYSQKGFELPSPSINNEVKLRATYLDIVPKLEYKPASFLGVYVGLNVGLKISESTKLYNASWNRILGVDVFNSSSTGINAGLRGYYKNIYLDVGCEYGITDVSQLSLTDINGEAVGTSDSKYRIFKFGLGYLFEL